MLFNETSGLNSNEFYKKLLATTNRPIFPSTTFFRTTNTSKLFLSYRKPTFYFGDPEDFYDDFFSTIQKNRDYPDSSTDVQSFYTTLSKNCSNGWQGNDF